MPREPFAIALVTTDVDAGENPPYIPCEITIGPAPADWRLSSVAFSALGVSASLRAAIDGSSLALGLDIKDQAMQVVTGTGNSASFAAPGVLVRQGKQLKVTLSQIEDTPPPGGYLLALTIFGIAENFGDKEAVENSVEFSIQSGGLPGAPKSGAEFG